MIRAAAMALAMAIALPAAAQDAAPLASERPKPRPEPGPDVEAPRQASPEEAADNGTGTADPPTEAREAGRRDVLRLDDASQASCLAALRDLGVVFQEVAAVVPDDDADCGILQPVKVSDIAPGITLIPEAVVRCPTAQAMAAWVQDFVLPAAARLADRGALVAIETGTGYDCRRRNDQADGDLSEHAFGNAFDVMGFRFEQGPPLRIEPRAAQGDMAEAFQAAVRASACLDFATVLGPGSNAFHDDHLHLDILVRTNGFRLCE
ncbi:extensin family protein [Paracoccaceae bacterium Fryx2]|nr:extensin family protein [Paracoccaceae bacterium Fryx2]MDT8858372.1 extensin family protein [Paracoccaceae bacterium Fryx2]